MNKLNKLYHKLINNQTIKISELNVGYFYTIIFTVLSEGNKILINTIYNLKTGVAQIY